MGQKVDPLHGVQVSSDDSGEHTSSNPSQGAYEAITNEVSLFSNDLPGNDREARRAGLGFCKRLLESIKQLDIDDTRKGALKELHSTILSKTSKSSEEYDQQKSTSLLYDFPGDPNAKQPGVCATLSGVVTSDPDLAFSSGREIEKRSLPAKACSPGLIRFRWTSPVCNSQLLTVYIAAPSNSS